MSRIKQLTGGLEKRFRICTLLSPFAMIFEVVFETLIPMQIVRLIDVGIANHVKDILKVINLLPIVLRIR